MCSADFPSGTTVTLTATPDPGYVFVGWGGACSGCGTSTTCTITMNANKTCSANFTASSGGGSGGGSVYTLSISPRPTNGTITSSPAGINCGSGGPMCSADFPSGTTVTLTATPDPGYVFVGWDGACASCLDNPTCIIPMSANTTCTANFIASSGGGSGSGSGGSGTDGSGSGSGGCSGSGCGSGSGGGGCSKNGSASSMAGLWNILVWLSVPAFVVARRIRKK